MKVKLKKDVKLSQNRNYSGLDTHIWAALNQGKTVELNSVPKIIKDKIEIITTSKKGDK